MKTWLKNLIHKIFARLPNTSAELTECGQEYPNYGALLDQIQPSPGEFESPEMAQILAHIRPTAVAQQIAITRIPANGQIPTTLEFKTLTAAGTVVRHIDFVVKDDFGQLGKAEQIKGRCVECNSYSFSLEICDECKAAFCPLHWKKYEDSEGLRILCLPDYRKAKANRNHWKEWKARADQQQSNE